MRGTVPWIDSLYVFGLCDRKPERTSRTQAFSIAGMESVNQPSATIKLGPVTLTQEPDGKIVAEHVALASPVQIDPVQLQRWLLRQLRELVAA